MIIQIDGGPGLQLDVTDKLGREYKAWLRALRKRKKHHGNLNVRIQQTGIGQALLVVCPDTKANFDLSDYDRW